MPGKPGARRIPGAVSQPFHEVNHPLPLVGRQALETSDDVLGLAAMQADRFPNARGPPIVEKPLEEPDADQGRGPELRWARLTPTHILKVRSELAQQEIRVEGLVGEAWHVAAIAANLREQLRPRGILAAPREGEEPDEVDRQLAILGRKFRGDLDPHLRHKRFERKLLERRTARLAAEPADPAVR